MKHTKPDQNQTLSVRQILEKAAQYDRTAGERIHNEITYRGVDFLANTAFAVSFAYLANRTEMGARLFSEPVQKAFRTVLRPFIQDEKVLHHSAELGTNFTSIVVGGTAIIPPMVMLDHHKRPIIERLDRSIYGDSEVDRNERFAVRYAALDHVPKKDFWTGMLARGIVLTPMISAHMNEKTNPLMNEYLYQPVAWGSKTLASHLGIDAGKLAREGRYNKLGQFESNWDYLHSTLGMDVSLTFIYSYAHEWTYKFLTRMFHRKAQDTAQAAPQAHIDASESKRDGVLAPPAEKGIQHA